MTEFDKQPFEELMETAIALHGQRQYGAALEVSKSAYDMASDYSSEKGRAARDIGARCARLGRIDEAEKWANEAYFIHYNLLQNAAEPTREAYRDRAASAMYVGVNGLRKAIDARRTGQGYDDTGWTIFLMRQTMTDLGKSKSLASGINQKFDQYEINASRRVSLAESVIGHRKSGRSMGAHAVRLAFMSESPRLDTSANLDKAQRLRAKAKAFAGGVAALGVGILMSEKAGRRQNLALKLAYKTL